MDEERRVNDSFFVEGQELQVLSMICALQDCSLLWILEILSQQHYVPSVKILSFIQSYVVFPTHSSKSLTSVVFEM